MSKKLPWFPFYYLDWLSDSEVAMMTYSEKGLFIDMLARCFNEGGLPAEEKKLIRLFKCDADDLQECVKMFYKKEEKLFNKKLDSIQKDQRKISAGRSKAGKVSAEKRKAQRLIDSTNVEQVLNPVATNPQQNPTNTTQQNRTQQNTKTIEVRTTEFKELIATNWEKLGGEKYLNRDEVNKFWAYWCEKSENGKKMRFEMAKNQPFAMGRRLGTWKANANNGRPTGDVRP